MRKVKSTMLSYALQAECMAALVADFRYRSNKYWFISSLK
ncbi:hypothetical protein CSB69_4339 [Morganella morganii]|nr:hypothetical protein CSB69_4339 [Morganella morganii]